MTNIQWDKIEDEDAKAEMIAFYKTENKIMSYEQHLQELKNRKRNIGKGWPNRDI